MTLLNILEDKYKVGSFNLEEKSIFQYAEEQQMDRIVSSSDITNNICSSFIEIYNYKANVISIKNVGGDIYIQTNMIKLLTYLFFDKDIIPLFDLYYKDKPVIFYDNVIGSLLDTKIHALSLIKCNGEPKLYNNSNMHYSMNNFDWLTINGFDITNLYVDDVQGILTLENNGDNENLIGIVNIYYYTRTSLNIPLYIQANNIFNNYNLLNYDIDSYPLDTIFTIDRTNIVNNIITRDYFNYKKLELILLLLNSNIDIGQEQTEESMNYIYSLEADDIERLFDSILNQIKYNDKPTLNFHNIINYIAQNIGNFVNKNLVTLESILENFRGDIEQDNEKDDLIKLIIDNIEQINYELEPLYTL